ncbi:MAG: DUF6617 family protein [Ginsengibacter sp.]
MYRKINGTGRGTNDSIASSRELSAFGFNRVKHQQILEKIYLQLNKNLTDGFVDSDHCTQKQFVDLLVHDQPALSEIEIRFTCESTVLRYVLNKMKKYSRNFRPSRIARSGKFYTKNGIPLGGSNIYKKDATDLKEIADSLTRMHDIADSTTLLG